MNEENKKELKDLVVGDEVAFYHGNWTNNVSTGKIEKIGKTYIHIEGRGRYKISNGKTPGDTWGSGSSIDVINQSSIDAIMRTRKKMYGKKIIKLLGKVEWVLVDAEIIQEISDKVESILKGQEKSL